MYCNILHGIVHLLSVLILLPPYLNPLKYRASGIYCDTLRSYCYFDMNGSASTLHEADVNEAQRRPHLPLMKTLIDTPL